MVLYPVDSLQQWLGEQAQVEGDRVETVVREVLEQVSNG